MYNPIPILHNTVSKASVIFAHCYGRSIAQCECFESGFFFRNMTHASGPAHCSLSYVSEKIIVCFSNIATNIVESLPGIWRKGGGDNG